MTWNIFLGNAGGLNRIKEGEALGRDSDNFENKILKLLYIGSS